VTDATSPVLTDTVMLDAAHLSRSFGKRLAVDDVSFHVAPGGDYGLLGPNGAGKTTTIRLVCGLLSTDTGDITVSGMPVSASTTTAKAQIGYVPQDVSLYPDLTARENLSFFGRLYRLSGKALRERVDEVLDLIDLMERGNDRVESFSGGMKRRLNIGASLLHRPRLLVLDEPTVGVDPQSRHAILESIQTLGSAGLAVLYTTHYMEEAERLCDRIGIIDHGHLIAEGTSRELVSQVGEKDRITLSASGSLAAFAQACRSLEGIERADVTASVVARHGATVQAANFATSHTARSFEQNLATTRSLQRETPAAAVRTDVVNRKSNFLPLGCNYSAPTMLVLFVFINALAGGAAMIQTRRYGIFARALAAPIRPRDLVLGETLCYLTLAVGQAVLIVVVGAVMFGVSWGNPLAAAALIGMWTLVGTGAGMVSGTLFRTPEQASAIGPAVGIAFGMLGGCMWPLEIVPRSVNMIGHATPHAWAGDAWVTLVSRGGGLVDIAGYLAILAGYAVALFAFASYRLRRSLVTP